ncbi:Membrane metallo-endopeptidase-like 1 [Manis javanica]|nr:Membrane metallo-endopeptidase-like 1 [Manis javanica]
MWVETVSKWPEARDSVMGKPESRVGTMEMARWQGQKRRAFLERVLLLVTGALVTLGLLYVDSRAKAQGKNIHQRDQGDGRNLHHPRLCDGRGSKPNLATQKTN